MNNHQFHLFLQFEILIVFKPKSLIFFLFATSSCWVFPHSINIVVDGFAGEMVQESLYCLDMLWANCLLASAVNICYILLERWEDLMIKVGMGRVIFYPQTQSLPKKSFHIKNCVIIV